MPWTAEDQRYILTTMLAYPALYRAELAGVPAEQLLWKPSEREWSLNEVIAHLAHTQQIYQDERLVPVSKQIEPRFPGFDQEQYAIEYRYNEQDAMDNLDRFARYQVATVALAQVTDWERLGHHQQDGPVTFGDLVLRLARHQASHLNQMRRLRIQWLQRRP